MTKRIKAKALATREEFEAAVELAASRDVEIRYIEARRDHAITRIKARFGAKIDPLATERDAQVALAEKYAEEHRKELLPDKKKSGDTAAATFGWRTGNRTVKLLSKLSPEKVIEKLKALRLGRYVRSVEEIDKAKILLDAQDDQTLLPQPKLGEVNAAAVPLSEAGLKITQGETFFIEAKVETAQALKTVENAA